MSSSRCSTTTRVSCAMQESRPPRGCGQALPGAPETSGLMPRSRRWPSSWPAGTGGRFRHGPGCPDVRHGPGGSSPTCEASTRAPWLSRRLRSAAAASSSPVGHLTAHEHRPRAGGHPRAFALAGAVTCTDASQTLSLMRWRRLMTGASGGGIVTGSGPGLPGCRALLRGASREHLAPPVASTATALPSCPPATGS
jgi:hypothetical protein